MNKRVLLFLSHGFEELEAAAFTDVMGWSRDLGLEAVDLTTVGKRPQIRGTWNLIVTPEKQLDQVSAEDFDALAIPGGFEEAGYYEDVYSEEFQNLIRDFDDADKPIATICVGALPVGKSGILKEKNATTYYLDNSIRPAQLQQFGATFCKKPVVVDGNIITSCGPATATEVAFTLLELLTSKENRVKVMKSMGYGLV